MAEIRVRVAYFLALSHTCLVRIGIIIFSFGKRALKKKINSCARLFNIKHGPIDLCVKPVNCKRCRTYTTAGHSPLNLRF